MWTVEPKKFAAVLEVLNLVPERPGLPSSSFVQLQGSKDELSLALSAEAAGSVHIKGDGVLGLKKPVYLDRSLLLAFVFASMHYRSKKPFTFSVDKEQLLLAQGNRKARFQFATEGSGYLEKESLSGGSELPLNAGLIELLKIALSCATLESTVPELNCLFLRQSASHIELFASNQLVLFHAHRKEKAVLADSLAFPVHLVPFLSADQLKAVRLRKKDVVLDFPCGQIWHPLLVKAQKGFPIAVVEGLIKSGAEWPERFSLPMHRLGTIVGRFSTYLGSAKKENWSIKVQANQGDERILFESLIPQAEFREQVKIEEPIKETFSLDWPLDLLLPVFEYLAKDKEIVLTVRFGKKTPYLLDAGAIQLVVSRRSDGFAKKS